MARTRDTKKESVFVNNEYFEKCGISRQVVRYRLVRGDIKPAGEFQGMNLYFQIDADLLILDYWIDNYKRFLKLIEISWENLRKVEKKYRSYNKSKMVSFMFDPGGNMNDKYLPSELIEFKYIICKHQTEPFEKNNKLKKEFDKKYKEGIEDRSFRFEISMLSIDDFIKEENLNAFHGKTASEIEQEYLIKKWFRDGEYKKIENSIDSQDPEKQDYSKVWIIQDDEKNLSRSELEEIAYNTDKYFFEKAKALYKRLQNKEGKIEKKER